MIDSHTIGGPGPRPLSQPAMSGFVPFGAHRPPAWVELLIRLCQRIPPHNWLLKRLVFLLRKPVMARRQSPLDVTVLGLKMRLQPHFKNVSDKRVICTPGLLDGLERQFLIGALSQGATVLDVGANIGAYSLLLAGPRPDLSFIAIEADPAMAERLAEQIALNDMQARFTCLNCAATDAPGEVTLLLDHGNRGHSRIPGAAEHVGPEAETITVPGLPLTRILQQAGNQRAELFKLDIEGHELPVLTGYFRQADPADWPRFIQIEQHRKHALNEAVRLTLAQGYRLVLRSRMNVLLEKS